MPKISVITPTHDTKRLHQAYDSLRAQTEQDWEWIIVPNNGAVLPAWVGNDTRIVVAAHESDKIGELKHHGFKLGAGDWLVELDHDDTLMPTALEKILQRKEDFVYSNSVTVNEAGIPQMYSAYYGWQYRDNPDLGLETVSPLIHPSNWSRIWYAPNHLRAWKRDFYNLIGGHDPDLPVADDHDLVCRSYIEGSVGHIDEPLYRYLVHDTNTWHGDKNAKIQELQWENCDRYLIPMYQKWRKELGLSALDLGGRYGCPEDFISVDRMDADVNCNLDEEWPFTDNSAGIIRAHDVIEHLKDPIHVMNEAWRVLKHGGLLDILVPSTDGVGAFCDPTHVSFWNIRSFKYYTHPETRKYIEPECRAKFQSVRIRNILQWDEKIPYVQAQLTAVKDGDRLHGAGDWYGH